MAGHHSQHRYARIAAKLRNMRVEHSLTQAQLASKLGVDQTIVSKYESGERRVDVVEAAQICAILGESLDSLAAAAGIPTPEKESATTGQSGETFAEYPALDRDWEVTDWERLVIHLVDLGMVTWKEVGALVLGHLNPSQVGTSIATKKTFQKHFPSRKTWEAVRQWHFEQPGRCTDCGTRLELQADHINPREVLGDEADRLDNMTLRCRRCNVIRRPSHKRGGVTYLTAEAALMWILVIKRPRTYQEFERLCREYGLTMANIRFQESWAMARWLARDGLYDIDPESKF